MDFGQVGETVELLIYTRKKLF